MQRLVLRGVWIGALSGAAGVVVMTAGEKLEQRLTHRPDSHVPGRTLARLLGTDVSADSAAAGRWTWTMHLGTAVAVGTLRGVMAVAGLTGPWASAMFTVVRLEADQTVENLTGVGAPPWTWPRPELAVDVLHKTVYAFSTGAVADLLATRSTGRPGQAHADRRVGRHADVGPTVRPTR